MPRYGNYRSYRRRAKRYGKHTFSSFNLYKRRSSKAQAYQIYRLNKKMNAIQRATKPETKILHWNNSEAVTTYNAKGVLLTSINLLNATPSISNTALESVIDGRMARLNTLKFLAHLHYKTNKQTVEGVVTDNTSSTAGISMTEALLSPILVRMLFVQTKTALSAAPDMSTILDTTSGLTSSRGPLNDGAGRIIKVLKDKKVQITYTNQSKLIRCKFNYLRNFYNDNNLLIPKGNLYCFLVVYNPITISSGTVPDEHQVSIDYNIKLAYSDA